MNSLDMTTTAACIVALRAREQECRRLGISTEHWERAKRRVKAAILERSAEDIKQQTPAFIRRQAD